MTSTSLASASRVAQSADEHAVVFCNASHQSLVGVWHAAQIESGASANASTGNASNGGAKACDCAIIMLHGWSGYRTGPHQMLTRAARDFAQSGWNVLRFDFAGRGDSDGNADLATLATMADDARAAMRWCKTRKNVSRVVLLGLCSGCEVAFACAGESEIMAVALWSAPVFAAGQSDQRQKRKRMHHLKQYARKMLRPSTYAKLLSGRLDRKSIQKAVAAGGGESKNQESTTLGHLPPGWRDQALKRFQAFHAPLLLVYGTSDPTTEEALAWHRARLREVKGAKPQAREHLVAGANHSFYGLAWEREVLEATRRWLLALK